MKFTLYTFLVLLGCCFANSDVETVNDVKKVIDKLLEKFSKHKEYVEEFRIPDEMMSHLSFFDVTDCYIRGLANMRKTSPFALEKYSEDLFRLKGRLNYESLTAKCTISKPTRMNNDYTGKVNVYVSNLDIKATIDVQSGTVTSF